MMIDMSTKNANDKNYEIEDDGHFALKKSTSSLVVGKSVKTVVKNI